MLTEMTEPVPIPAAPGSSGRVHQGPSRLPFAPENQPLGTAVLGHAIRLTLAVLLTIMVPWSASAEHADFTGTWALDTAASGSMDPIFKLQGISWAKRKVGAKLDAEQKVTQTADKITTVFNNLKGTITQEMYFDGKPHATVNPAGYPVTFTSHWFEDGKVLVSTGPTVTDQGITATITERRSLSADGKILVLQLEVVLPDGRKASTKRVFLRK